MVTQFLRQLVVVAVVSLLALSAGAATFDVKAYGAAGNGTTDDTLAIRQAVKGLLDAGGGTLYFPPGTYKILGTGTNWLTASTYGAIPSAGYGLGLFDGLTGVRLIAEGATLAIDSGQFSSHSGNGSLFVFVNCTDVLVDGFVVTGPTMSLTGTIYGVNFVALSIGNRNVSLPNNKVSGCESGVTINRDSPSTQANTQNVWIGNLDVTNCIYGVNTTNSPDNLVVEHLNTNGVTRSYTTSGTRNHKVNVVSHGSYSYDCVIGTSAELPTEDIDLQYTSGTDYAASSSEHARVLLSLASTSSHLRNIGLHFNVEYDTSTGGGPVVRIEKFVSAAQTLDGLTISGYIKGQPNPGGSNLGDVNGPIIGTYDGSTWTSSDHFRNIALRDLRIENSKYVRFVMPGLVGPFVIDNVQSDTSVQLMESSTDATPPHNGLYAITGSDFTNRATYIGAESAPSLDFIAGGGTRTIPTGWQGHTISSVGNGSSATWTLPAAVPGLEYTFIRATSSDLYIAPVSTDSIRGGLANKYVQLASAGGSIHLRCVEATKWEIVASYGTLTYQP